MRAGGGSVEGGAGANPAALETEMLALKRAEDEHRERIGQFASIRAERERADLALDQARTRAREAENASNERRDALARADQSVALAEAHSGNSRRRLGASAELVGTSNARLEEPALAEQDARARRPGSVRQL